MKKPIILSIIVLLMASSVFAVSMDRQSPSQVDANSQFTITYVADPEGETNPWAITVDDVVTGGCTPTEIQFGMYSTDDHQRAITITAPVGGSCTIDGNYEYTIRLGDNNYDQQVVNFADDTITISGDCVLDTCISLGYTCGSYNDGCGGTILCGSCSTGYSCSGGSCVLDSQLPDCTTSPDICPPGHECNANGRCVEVVGDDKCDFYQEEDKETGECEIATWVWVVGGVLAAYLIISKL